MVTPCSQNEIKMMNPNPSFWSFPCRIPMSGLDFNTCWQLLILLTFVIRFNFAASKRIRGDSTKTKCRASWKLQFWWWRVVSWQRYLSFVWNNCSGKCACCWANITRYFWSYMVFLMSNVLILLQEAANNKNGRAPHSEWRNYDDFNEFFW